MPHAFSVVNPADFASASTTLANVPGLSFPVKANQRYRFRFVGTYTTSIVTTGPKVGLTAPTGVVAAQVDIKGLTAATATQASIVASAGSGTGADVAVINTEYLVTMEGFIKPTASGTLQVQYASETAATTTLKAGSTLEVFQQ